MSQVSERVGPAPLRWDCGVPPSECSGSGVPTNLPTSFVYKVHGDYDSARRCNRRYCERRGLMPSKPVRVKSSKANIIWVPAIRG